MKRASSTPRGTDALASAQRAREKLNEMLGAIRTGPSKMDKKALDDWMAQAKQMQEHMKPLDEEPKLKSRLDTVKTNLQNLSEAFIAIKPRLRAKVGPADVVLSTIDIELRAANTDKVRSSYLTVKNSEFDRQISVQERRPKARRPLPGSQPNRQVSREIDRATPSRSKGRRC